MSTIRKSHFFPAQIFDDFFARELWNRNAESSSNTNTTIPAVNIRETADNFEVDMAAPGMTREDFRVELDGNLLTISSEKENSQETEESNYSRREFSYQSFRRSFQLPKDVVDAENIKAKYENGVLKLAIPKKEEAKQKPPKMIQIQ